MNRPYEHDRHVDGYFMLLLVAAVCLIIYVIFVVKPMPIVYWSTSRNECVEIHYYNASEENWKVCDCEDMPDTYEKIWVE